MNARLECMEPVITMLLLFLKCQQLNVMCFYTGLLHRPIKSRSFSLPLNPSVNPGSLHPAGLGTWLHSPFSSANQKSDTFARSSPCSEWNCAVLYLCLNVPGLDQTWGNQIFHAHERNESENNICTYRAVWLSNQDLQHFWTKTMPMKTHLTVQSRNDEWWIFS